jgi:hypothetical protein
LAIGRAILPAQAAAVWLVFLAGFYFDVLESMYLKHCPDRNTMSTFNQLLKPMNTL